MPSGLKRAIAEPMKAMMGTPAKRRLKGLSSEPIMPTARFAQIIRVPERPMSVMRSI